VIELIMHMNALRSIFSHRASRRHSFGGMSASAAYPRWARAPPTGDR